MFDDISEKSLQIHWFTSLWATHPSYIQAVSNNTKYTNYSMDWFKGKSTGNHGIYHQIYGFPVNFPLNQFYKLYNYWCIYIYTYIYIYIYIHKNYTLFHLVYKTNIICICIYKPYITIQKKHGKPMEKPVEKPRIPHHEFPLNWAAELSSCSRNSISSMLAPPWRSENIPGICGKWNIP